VAVDAGADDVFSYGGVKPEAVRDLVHGAIFTRGPKDLRRTAIFIGGSDVSAGERLLQEVISHMLPAFGLRVSVLMDANGCNTTAAAAVARLASATAIAGARAVILAGTGPVGLRAAVLLAREGGQVTITSRSKDKGRDAAVQLKARFGVEVAAAEARDDAAVARALEGAQICLCAGAAGVKLLSRAVWATSPTLRVMGDVNAVPPLGIEGIEAGDKGGERDGKRAFGALGIGGLKMKTHKAGVARLYEQNDAVLDLDAIWSIAKTL